MEKGTTTKIECILSHGFWTDGDTVSFKTSGSTGLAKQILHNKQSLLVSARTVNRWLCVNASSVWGLALPLHHVGGFGVAARAYAADCEFAFYEGKWNPISFAKWIADKKVTHTSLVPTQIHDLLAAGFQAPPTLLALVVGGGKITPEAGQAARDIGWPILASYGMTETASQIATQNIDLIHAPYASSPLELLPIWEAEETPEGLLRIRGEALFAGTIENGIYHHREGEWYTTQDRVHVSDNNLTPLGRADSQVKVMGELIDLEHVEKRFLELAQGTIREGTFAVITIPDSRRENALIAVFERNCPEHIITAYQSQALGPERFVQWIAMEDFPRTDLGKLRRIELRRMYLEQCSS